MSSPFEQLFDISPFPAVISRLRDNSVIAINKRNEFNDHTIPDPANPLSQTIQDCNTTFLSPDCKAIQDSHESARKLSIIGFVAGGVLTAGAAVLWVLSSPKERAGGSSTAIACTPDFGTRGVACRMQF